MPLGLNLIEVLIHLFNLAILIVAVRFLLYKPIKKFIENRRKLYEDAEAESAAKKAEAQEMRAESEKLLSDARHAAATISDEMHVSAEVAADEIIFSAKKKATAMLKKAEEDAKRLSDEELMKIKQALPGLAITIASEILEREVKAEDNDVLIKSVLKDLDNIARS